MDRAEIEAAARTYIRALYEHPHLRKDCEELEASGSQEKALKFVREHAKNPHLTEHDIAEFRRIWQSEFLSREYREELERLREDGLVTFCIARVSASGIDRTELERAARTYIDALYQSPELEKTCKNLQGSGTREEALEFVRQHSRNPNLSENDIVEFRKIWNSGHLTREYEEELQRLREEGLITFCTGRVGPGPIEPQ
jgi:hypothetical protein